MSEAIPALGLGALLVLGVAADLCFGDMMKRRGLFHVLLCILAVVFVMAMPSCSTGHPDREGPDIPYSF